MRCVHFSVPCVPAGVKGVGPVTGERKVQSLPNWIHANFVRMPYFLFSPLTWGLVWGLLLLLAWGRLSRAWRGVGVAVGVVVLVMCMPLGANLLEYALESRVKESSRCTGQDAGPIVVLSGGFEYEPLAADDYATFTLETWSRTRAATEL